MLNGVIGPSFRPGRGLRQGDSLSPYLFMFVADVLSAMIQRLEVRGELEGVRVCRGAPSVSHLLYVDDTFICCKATEGAMWRIKEVLLNYIRTSSQVVNF